MMMSAPLALCRGTPLGEVLVELQQQQQGILTSTHLYSTVCTRLVSPAEAAPLGGQLSGVSEQYFVAEMLEALPIVDGIVLDVVCCQHAYFEIKAHQSPAWVDAGLQYLKWKHLLAADPWVFEVLLALEHSNVPMDCLQLFSKCDRDTQRSLWMHSRPLSHMQKALSTLCFLYDQGSGFPVRCVGGHFFVFHQHYHPIQEKQVIQFPPFLYRLSLQGLLEYLSANPSPSEPQPDSVVPAQCPRFWHVAAQLSRKRLWSRSDIDQTEATRLESPPRKRPHSASQNGFQLPLFQGVSGGGGGGSPAFLGADTPPVVHRPWMPCEGVTMPPRTIPPQAIGIRLSAPPAAPASPSSAGLWTSTQDQAASAAPLASVDLPPKCLPLPDSPSMGCSSFPPPPPLMAGDSLQEEYPAPKLGSMTHDIASILPEDFVLHNSLESLHPAGENIPLPKVPSEVLVQNSWRQVCLTNFALGTDGRTLRKVSHVQQVFQPSGDASEPWKVRCQCTELVRRKPRRGRRPSNPDHIPILREEVREEYICSMEDMFFQGIGRKYEGVVFLNAPVLLFLAQWTQHVHDLTGLAPFGVSLAHLFGGTDNSPSTGPPPPDLRQELERLRHRVSEYQQEVQSKTAALQQRHRSDTAGPGPQAAQAGLELQEFPRSGSPSSMISFSSASDFSSSSTTSSSPSQPPPA